jgi:Arc/MetJ-type ribon-helix-helix transcriptional regulator
MRSCKLLAVKRNKHRTSVALDSVLFQWTGEMVKKKYFASVSHAVEFSLQRQKDRQERGEPFG